MTAEDSRPRQSIRVLCYVTGALALGGAGAYVMFGSRKDVGCLLVIVAVILCRVLVLNVAEGR